MIFSKTNHVKRRKLVRAALKSKAAANNKNKSKVSNESSKSSNALQNSLETPKMEPNMSLNEDKARKDVLAARQIKKLAKQKGKTKDPIPKKKDLVAVTIQKKVDTKIEEDVIKKDKVDTEEYASAKPSKVEENKNCPKGNDEVDRVTLHPDTDAVIYDKNKHSITAERFAMKAAKQDKKKGVEVSHVSLGALVKEELSNEEMTVKDVVETLRDIVNVAKEIKDVTVKVSTMDLGGKKTEEEGKSKAQLRAERRAKQEAQRVAKQEAQRAAKEATQEQKIAVKPNPEKTVKPDSDAPKIKEASPAPKQKQTEKTKVKAVANRINWFQHLHTQHDKDTLKSIPINSNLHPAIVKLGVQLASRVVTGSNARCVALLDALKKMVRDYTLPAKTEFARGLESHLATSLEFLWSMRPPSATQTNAVKFFRYHLTQLPNNVDEFDAKKTLQEEIDRYVREQIDKAGEAISIAVRSKILDGDNILTYGCSSLVERILREAWSSGARFRTVVVGARERPSAREMLRRLVADGLHCTYIDITALEYLMNTVSKVVVGASALLGNGCVLGAAGTMQVALAARAHNVPMLVAAETHKFCERVQTDAFVYNEIGDPDDLVDKSDDNSPIKDWRSNSNLTPLNLTYDVTPPSLITAVVTELSIMPCTSAPVVLRFKIV